MSALAVSQIQKHFITNQIYKRSKRYFDVIKLKSIQHQDSKFRRMPSNVPKQQIQRKIQNSFMSSQQYFSKKRLQQIQKCKKKHCTSDVLDDTDQTQTNYSVVTKNNLILSKKGFDMSKSLSRQFYQNLQNHAYTSIQDPFDNFVSSDFSKGQKGKSIDFNKILGRKDISSKLSSISKSKNIEIQQNPQKLKILKLNQTPKINSTEITKAYEKFYFDQSKFKCLIDVQKEKKAEHRKLIRTSLKDYQNKQRQTSLQKIQKGRIFSQKKQKCASLVFYHGKGKQEPSQMHIRTLKKNENYWMEQIKKIRKQDFQTVKRRQQMIDRRLKGIQSKKQVMDERGQICDAKYFLRNRHN